MTDISVNNPAVELYSSLLHSWNKQDAMSFAATFADNGYCVGYDGSQMNGQDTIAGTLAEIFSHHETASYVSIVREIRAVSPDLTMLVATVGMIPPGGSAVNPARNAIQCALVRRTNAGSEIVLFQNTPAAYDGRPELSQALTQELSTVYASGKTVEIMRTRPR